MHIAVAALTTELFSITRFDYLVYSCHHACAVDDVQVAMTQVLILRSTPIKQALKFNI